MDFSVRSFLDFLHVILISSFQMMIVKYHDYCNTVGITICSCNCFFEVDIICVLIYCRKFVFEVDSRLFTF